MAFLKSNPEKTLQRDIDAAQANRDRLSAKLVECETAIVERRGAARALARDGADDSALEKAEAAIRSAQDRVPSPWCRSRPRRRRHLPTSARPCARRPSRSTIARSSKPESASLAF
jgi:hypothetical protein